MSKINQKIREFFNDNIYKPMCATILCIRYPFLYPRNRWNSKHHPNWDLENYLYGNYHNNTRGLVDKVYKEICPPSAVNHYKGVYKIKNLFWWIVFKILVFYNENIYPIFHCIPTYTEWDAMPKGWNIAFGKRMLKDLRRQLIKDRMLYKWRILDLKEKYGSLHLYCNYGSHELYRLLDKYEELSEKTCIECGNKSTITTEGYILHYCDECFNKRK